MADRAWIGDDSAMRKTFPGPKGHGSPSYADCYSVGRQNRATRPAEEEKPRLKFLPDEEPLEFGINDPSPSPHQTGLGFVSAIFLTGLLLMAFIIWMQGW